jgi:hypothetical protein
VSTAGCEVDYSGGVRTVTKREEERKGGKRYLIGEEEERREKT